ncbi:nitroreductase family deazaflavin-dependent oxidoreductase [Paenibacillus sp. TRM 82003]|uniref:nitroreductase family deazaflavin-dependent oxidoreductase n=1 Tax=Kineococcus sp. TRM81007 TaxID=2925831 RepID=UPI001F5A7785|nr:nitroreductase family deazaflavin-dependent oxidoreductase [Kineococcus sp. TRM81007]MCI2237676.1 nitroreductase family deazaflavin-dependent oxidoreductase [Kineococcus sp. TRM81007]MCI3921694.1 nitroreductase family deazaflavin-dependent oxidoreductase [Paenibacillus sp. TRM 82003]
MSRTSRLLNAAPSLLLASPAHRVVRRRCTLLEFTGRRTGRHHRTPVAYVRHGSRVLVSTDSPWWRNLREQPAVRVRLRGDDRTGSARLVEDAGEAADALATLVRAVPGRARPAGLSRRGGVVPREELLRAVTSGGSRSIVITLGPRW